MKSRAHEVITTLHATLVQKFEPGTIETGLGLMVLGVGLALEFRI